MSFSPPPASGDTTRSEPQRPELPRELADHVQLLLDRERRILEAQKHDSLGILAGGIAHDFNNLLAVIIGQAELVAAEPGLSSRAQGALTGAISAAQRAAGLTRQLLDYAGRSHLREHTFCLAKETEALVHGLRSKLPAHVRLELSVEARELWVSGDSDRLQQSTLNLISNAVEAYGTQAGTVHLRLFEEAFGELRPPSTYPPEPVRPGSYVCMEVRDDGPGMAEATQQRIFEPFFTTKASGRGLGLPACLGVVRSHGGFLTVRSEPQRGALFRVYLPLLRAMRGEPAVAASVVVTPKAGARAVLVVDDEPMIRTFARAMLEDEGYVVHEAGSGPEALAILETRLHEVGAVLLDLSMPGMDGSVVLSKLRTFAPDLPVTLQTGYSAEVTAQRLAQWRVHGVLQKPYRGSQLLQTIASMFA